MTKPILPIALLLLASCEQTESAGPADAKPAAEAQEPAAPAPVSLAGNWTLTMIGGGDAKALGMTASFGDGRARLSNGCFSRGWTFSQSGNLVEFDNDPGAGSNCGGQTPGERHERAYATLDGVNMVVFSDGGRRADLSGDSGTLTLERS